MGMRIPRAIMVSDLLVITFKFYRVSQKKRPAFERLHLPEYIRNDIL